MDYSETFSLVAKLKIVRVLLSLVAKLNWLLHQIDVKNAFLHSDLELPGYTVFLDTNLVCKLEKASYRFKQSFQAWFGRISFAIKKHGYYHSNFDHTLFLKHQHGKVAVLLVYIDDMIITGDDREEISKLQL